MKVSSTHGALEQRQSYSSRYGIGNIDLSYGHRAHVRVKNPESRGELAVACKSLTHLNFLI